MNSDLLNISQITKNLFLSGIIPLDDDHHLIKKLNIKYIIVCVDRSHVSEVHDKIILENPDITILYLPYNDDLNQNLWATNNITILKLSSSMEDFEKINKLIQFYNKKPLIEIGYHFLDWILETNNNVLVHCMAGISRSASLVIYYFMKKYNINFDDALKMVKGKRNIINPNDSFKLQLKQFQKNYHN